VSETLSQYF